MVKLGIYRHFKGGLYRVIALARFRSAEECLYQGEDDSTRMEGCLCAVYIALKDGSMHIRPTFEWDDDVKSPINGETVKRFVFEYPDA